MRDYLRAAMQCDSKSFSIRNDPEASEKIERLLILSIHIPKAAGQSFQARLEATFASRAFFDYGDWVGYDTPDTIARREFRRTMMRARRDELLRDYDIIHGHFLPEKYIGLFPTTKFAAFFRDPYQQVVSHYHYFLRHPEIDHPAVRLFHETHMSLPEFSAAFPDIQSKFLGELRIEDLAMVGLLEQYDRSVALFGAVFGCKIAPETSRVNVNPYRQGGTYSIDGDVRKAVDTHRALDLELYRRARERFGRLSAHYGI